VAVTGNYIIVRIAESDGQRAPAQRVPRDAGFRYMMGYFEDCGRKAGDGAARWYSLAAVQGHGQAQLALSLHLQRGSGGARADAKEAEAWMMLARAQGVLQE
jgi:TPR repeat protein